MKELYLRACQDQSALRCLPATDPSPHFAMLEQQCLVTCTVFTTNRKGIKTQQFSWYAEKWATHLYENISRWKNLLTSEKHRPLRVRTRDANCSPFNYELLLLVLRIACRCALSWLWIRNRYLKRMCKHSSTSCGARQTRWLGHWYRNPLVSSHLRLTLQGLARDIPARVRFHWTLCACYHGWCNWDGILIKFSWKCRPRPILYGLRMTSKTLNTPVTVSLFYSNTHMKMLHAEVFEGVK